MATTQPGQPSRGTELPEREKTAFLGPFSTVSRTVLRSVFQEERFFLVLSVFIGIFSGLAVVCFRFAIDWCHVSLLGSEFMDTPAHLIIVPTLAGLVVAALVIHVFPQSRGSGVNQTKGAL